MTGDVLLSFLLLLISCSFLPSAVAQDCHPDWLLFGEKCYGFGEEKVSWAEADDICGSFHAKLAEVESAAENNFLKTTCSEKKGDAYWLGGTDIFHEGVWRWVSTEAQISSFTDWAAGKPNDNDGQDCLSMYGSMGYQWNDQDCSNLHFFICERVAETVVG